MRINQLAIKNYKMFHEKHLQFNSNFSLIIGDNGSGKTSILESLSIGLGGFLAGIDGMNTRNIALDEVRVFNDFQGDATYTSEPQFPCEVCCSGTINDKAYTWKRSLQKKNGRTDRTNAKQIIDYASQLQYLITQQNSQNIILPVFSYQSAGRLHSQKKEKWTNPFESQSLSRFMGYTDCLEAESNMKLFINWLRKMTLISLQKGIPIGELTSTLKAIENFMALMMDKQDLTIYFNFEIEEVVVKTENKEIALRLMSSGYRSLIGMVADLAFRMSLLNPHLKEEASTLTPGVVLIDEIDLHLHPKWQWKIVEALKSTFPKIQFIATTHAPIVIASCKNGEIININDGISTKSSNYGWLVQDVLAEVMNTKNRTHQVNEKIETYEELINKQMLDIITEKELSMLESLEKELLQILPERDPAITLAKLNALKKNISKVDD